MNPLIILSTLIVIVSSFGAYYAANNRLPSEVERENKILNSISDGIGSSASETSVTKYDVLGINCDFKSSRINTLIGNLWGETSVKIGKTKSISGNVIPSSSGPSYISNHHFERNTNKELIDSVEEYADKNDSIELELNGMYVMITVRSVEAEEVAREIERVCQRMAEEDIS